MTKTWLTDLIDQCKDVETPPSWIYWSLLTAISAAASGYDLWTLKGNVKYRANLFVLLMGPSGAGKGFGINLAKKLVGTADVTRMFAGRGSIQGIVTELGTARSRENGKPMFTDSRGYINSSELSSSIVADPAALPILTDLYDAHYQAEGWQSVLKESKNMLKSPYLVMLSGSSPAHFFDTIPKANIEGGFIGRTVMVYEERRAKNLDMFSDENSDETDSSGIDSVQYAKHLIDINNRKARLVPNTDAKILYNEWRRKYRDTQREDSTGFLQRVPDHVLKVAMCLCLSRYNHDTVIRGSDIEEAIYEVQNVIPASKRMTEAVGDSPLSKQTKIILDLLFKAPEHCMNRRQLLARGMGYYDMRTLDIILENLIEVQWIDRIRILAGESTDWKYRMKETLLDQYKNLVERKRT